MPLRRYAVAAVVIGLALVALNAPHAWQLMSGKPWDGLLDWWPARFWWEGTDPYSKANVARNGGVLLGHPPTTSFYALPFALFDLSWMGRLLGVVALGLLATQLWLMARELRVPAPRASALLAFGLLLCTPFLRLHLQVAQVSELIAFAIFLAWYFLRRGRDAAAGVALGLACTIKFFPGGLVLLLMVYRRWAAVASAALVWLAVAILMTARFGWASWRHYFASEQQIVDWWIGHASNVTFQGLVVRAFHPACATDTWSDPRATRVALALSLLLLGALIASCHRALQRNFVDLPFALFTLWSMLANVFYWEHYHVILLLPLAIAAVALRRAHAAGLSRRWSLVCAAALVGAMAACLIAPNTARVLLYASRTRPQYHLRAHLTEILTALPMPLLLLVNGGLLRWFTRRDFRGLSPFHLQ